MHILDLLLRPVTFVAMLLVRPCLWSLRVPCGDVWIVDLHAGNCDPPTEFHDQIDRALSFIRERDPRRAKWIDQHINYIVNSSMLDSGGKYIRDGKMCCIHYGSYREYVAGDGDLTPRAQEVLTIELAQIIVHEATHGRIDERGIGYNERTRERIERFCRRQEIQFLKRAAAGFQDLFGVTVDWEATHADDWIKWYQARWRRSRFKRLRDRMQTIIDDIRNTPQGSDPLPTWQGQHRSLWEAVQVLKPWTEAMLRSRAFCLYGAKNFAEAADDFRLLTELQPEYVYAREWWAINKTYGGDYVDALELWLAEYTPKNARAAKWISHCLNMLGRHDEGLQWYQQSDDDEPGRYTSRTELAWRLIRLGRFEEALQHLDWERENEEIEADTGDFTSLAVHASLLRELGDRERFRQIRDELYAARDWWYQCCEADPVKTRAWILQTLPEISRPGVVSCRAQLLICTDDLPPFDWQGYMEQLSEKILASETTEDRSYESAYLRSLLHWNDEYPWREVPEDLTGGKRVYVLDMMLDRLFLPGGYLQGKSVTCCLAETPDGYDAALAETYDAAPGPLDKQAPRPVGEQPFPITLWPVPMVTTRM